MAKSFDAFQSLDLVMKSFSPVMRFTESFGILLRCLNVLILY